MKPEEIRRNAVEKLLSAAVADIESRAADGKKKFDISGATMTYDATRLLGFKSLSRKLAKIMDTLTFGDSMRGVITNIPVSPDRCQEKLTFKSMAEIEEEYPRIDFDYIHSMVRFGQHIAYCASGAYDSAMAEAKTELDKVEVAHALALVGEFDLAKKIITDFDDRIDDFDTVLCIELFRRARFDEAEALLAQMEPSLGAWHYPQLAFGIVGRRAWQPYPFPDY